VAKILVLVEPDDRYLWNHHLMRSLLARWKRAGHRVGVHVGPDRPPAADLAILHVDLSVVPPEYLDAIRHYPVAVNGGIGDIRKRSISSLLVQQDDGYAGPVIVKSDLNSGGRPEMLKWMKAAQRLGRAPGPPVAAFKGDYPVYKSKRGVPDRVWSNAGLVVEKFMPEIDAEGYCLRYYYFFGDAEMNLLLHSKHGVVKNSNVLRVEHAPVPEKLRAMRRAMGFEYGKFDYVLRGGEAVLLDANRTPALSLLRKFNLVTEMADRLAAGLDGLLPAQARTGRSNSV